MASDQSNNPLIQFVDPSKLTVSPYATGDASKYYSPPNTPASGQGPVPNSLANDADTAQHTTGDTAQQTTDDTAKLPLDGCRVRLSGSLGYKGHGNIGETLKDLGAHYCYKRVIKEYNDMGLSWPFSPPDHYRPPTHVIASPMAYDNASDEVCEGEKYGAYIVTSYWLADCVKFNRRMDEKPYCFNKKPKVMYNEALQFQRRYGQKPEQEKGVSKIDRMKHSSTPRMLLKAILDAADKEVPELVRQIRTCVSLDSVAGAIMGKQGFTDKDEENNQDLEENRDKEDEGDKEGGGEDEGETPRGRKRKRN